MVEIIDKTGAIGLTVSEAEELLTRATSSMADCGKIFFPGRFRREFDEPHHEIFKYFDTRHTRQGPHYKALAAPRGTGKTSINTLLLPTFEILRGTSHYISVVSHTYSFSEKQTENLKESLLENDLLRYFFGDISVPKKGRQWMTKELWQVHLGGEKFTIEPKGSMQQLRGMLMGDDRPDCVICDDLENPEELLSAEARIKQKDWFWGTVFGLREIGSTNFALSVLGTIVHPHCLLQDLLDDPRWNGEIYELCDDQFNTYFPNAISNEGCEELYETMRTHGKTHIFSREYRNRSADPLNAMFTQSKFKYYDEHELELRRRRDFEGIVIIDPSRTPNPASADTAIMGISVNVQTQQILIRECRQGKWSQDQIFEEMFEVAENTPNLKLLAPETDGLESWLLNPLYAELVRRKMMHVGVLPLKAKQGVIEGEKVGADEKGKVTRIRGMAYYYNMGFVYHNKTQTGSYEEQLLLVPAPKEWGLVDCAGYIPYILQEGERILGDGAPSDDETEDEARIDRLLDRESELELMEEMKVI